MTDKPTIEPAAFATFLMQWNAEMLGLYGKRMQEYCMMPLNLMLCTSADDFKDLQDRFSSTLQSDYGDAAGKLVEAVGGTATDSHATESYAGVLLKAQKDARAIVEQARAQASRILAEAEERAGGLAAPQKTSQAA